jgi:L-alanine-DL-glutamate epimerase-like enolase superfamily enzyme
MKITKIEIFDCVLPKWGTRKVAFNPVLLRLHTDEGITGIGEAGLAYGRSSKAAVGQLRDFAPMLLGRDPMKVEAIWEDLFRGTYWGTGGGPVVYAGISAYDIACWDIRGKALGVPIYQLLGGKTNDDLRCYASQIQLDWGAEETWLVETADYAKAARKAIEDGYDAVKVDPLAFGHTKGVVATPRAPQRFHGLLGYDDIKIAVDRIAAIRDEVGPAVDIIVEVHGVLAANSSLQLAQALDPYRIMFYEEPTHPLNAEVMARVAQRSSIPIATGERSYTRWGYRELLEKQSVAVIQPDLCLVGGITEGKKVCDYGNLYDATVQVHICGAPVSTAAALQLEAVIPNFIIHEHHANALKAPLRELCVHDYQPVSGRYQVPDLPGLGQELNDEVVGRHLACTIQ